MVLLGEGMPSRIPTGKGWSRCYQTSEKIPAPQATRRGGTPAGHQKILGCRKYTHTSHLSSEALPPEILETIRYGVHMRGLAQVCQACHPPCRLLCLCLGSWWEFLSLCKSEGHSSCDPPRAGQWSFLFCLMKHNLCSPSAVEQKLVLCKLTDAYSQQHKLLILQA